MLTKRMTVITGMIGIFLVLVLTAFIYLMGIRGEFKKYLHETYSELTFSVGFTRIDPIYGKFYANVTCLNDYTSFPISKTFKTKEIHEDYIQYKSTIQYNTRIKEIFYGSKIERYIKNVTGGSKTPFEESAIYDQINIHLSDDAEQKNIAKETLHMLKENNISARLVIFTYEKDKHVYEIRLSSDDNYLTEKEIEARVRMIK